MGVFGGKANAVSLEQLRDFFGVGTNIIPVDTYPVDDQASPLFGKNGDLILTRDTNRIYQKTANAFPPKNSPTAVLEGTKVDDTKMALDTSWSSRKIDEYIRGAVAVALDLAPAEVKRVPFFAKVLLESLRISLGPDTLQARLLLSNGNVVTTQNGTGAAVIGAVSLAIDTMTAAEAAAGYNVEFSNPNAAAITALLRTIPR